MDSALLGETTPHRRSLPGPLGWLTGRVKVSLLTGDNDVVLPVANLRRTTSWSVLIQMPMAADTGCRIGNAVLIAVSAAKASVRKNAACN